MVGPEGGGWVVLLLFSIMLLPSVSSATPHLPKKFLYLWVVGILSGIIWIPSYYAWHDVLPGQGVPMEARDAVADVGLQLLGPYAFAFEWTAFSLLISLVGAVYIVRL